MEHMYGLQGIVEGFESAHTARAQLQLDSAVNCQGESVVAELAFGVHIHDIFDSFPFFVRLAGDIQKRVQVAIFLFRSRSAFKLSMFKLPNSTSKLLLAMEHRTCNAVTSGHIKEPAVNVTSWKLYPCNYSNLHS